MEFIPDDVFQASILDSAPVPKLDMLNVRKLDQEVLDLMPERQQKYIPKKDGSNRPIINLKRLNGYVRYEHFKMEGIVNVVDLLSPGIHMVNLDLNGVYFGNFEDSKGQVFSEIRWLRKLCRFWVVPFGMGSVPRCFFKLMKPKIALMPRSGIKCVIYLIELITLHQSPQILKTQFEFTIWLLEHLGFLIYWEKSIREPTRQIN